MNKSIKYFLIVFALLSIGAVTNRIYTGDRTFDGQVLITGNTEYVQPIIQVHRIATIEPTGTGWETVKFDTLIANETTNYITFNADSTGVLYTGTNPCVLRLQGCLHPDWTGANGTQVTTLARVTVEGSEARCSQSNWKRTNSSGDNFKMDVIGTIYVTNGDEVCMQYKVSNTGMDFQGDAGFDSPVAASINFEFISKK